VQRLVALSRAARRRTSARAKVRSTGMRTCPARRIGSPQNWEIAIAHAADSAGSAGAGLTNASAHHRTARDPRQSSSPPLVPPLFVFRSPLRCARTLERPEIAARRLEPFGDSIEIDLTERVADERTAIGLGEAPRFQRFDHAVQALEVVGVHRDANHFVVGRLRITFGGGLRDRFGWRWSAAGVEAVLQDASDVLLRALWPKVCSFAHRSTPPAHGWITDMRCSDRYKHAHRMTRPPPRGQL